jgi:type II secretory pathway component PulM
MMIKNERQYRITRAQVARFEAALQEVAARKAASPSPSVLDRAQENALRSQLSDLQAEVSEYETLKSGKITTFQAESFADLPATLTRARIATGLSQKDLAVQLGIKDTAGAAVRGDRLRLRQF